MPTPPVLPPKGKGPVATEALDAVSAPANKEKVEAAKEFMFHLVKGIKNIGIYKHNTTKFPEFLQRACDVLTKYTETHGAMSLKVEADAFSMHKQPVFEASSAGYNLPYKFYRDGIRQLIFRPGISTKELVDFTLVALSDAVRVGEDIVSQLWKTGLEHVEYVVVQGFAAGEASEEQVQVEVDKIVAFLYQRLRSDSDDFLRFARLEAQDLDAKIEGVDQIRGAVVTGSTASDEYKTKLQRELVEEENHLFPKVTQTLSLILDSGTITDVALLKDLFVQILDSLLLVEDFATIVAVLTKLRSMGRDPNRQALGAPLLEFFSSKMSEEQRLRALGETVKRGKVKNAGDIEKYLSALDESAIVPLLEVLDTIEMPENRALLVDRLAELGANRPEPFVNRLQSEKSQMVRDMIAVIERCNFPDKLKYFGQALENKNPAVRLEVIGLLARSRTEQARRFVLSAMADPSDHVRVHAAKALARAAPERALQEIMRVVQDDGFHKRDLKEREGWYSALGLTQMPGAFLHFSELLEQKGLFGRGRIAEGKLLAIAGLTAMTSMHALKALQGANEDKSNSDEVRAAARKGMLRVRRQVGTGASADEPKAREE